MSKSTTVNGKPAQPTLPKKSAWSNGPPTSTPATVSTPSNASPAVTAPASGPVPPANGFQTHSRRPSAAVSTPQAPGTLSTPVSVRPNAGGPAATPGHKPTSSLQFGSVGNAAAPPSTSPAPPSALPDREQVKTFGSVSAIPKQPAGSSPITGKPPASLSAGTPSAKPKSKIDIHKLFQKPNTNAATAGSVSATSSSNADVDAQTSTAPASQATPAPEPVPSRPPPSSIPSFDPNSIRNSPSVRNTSLPGSNGPPQGQPYGGPHMRQQNGIASPRAPSFNRGGANGAVRGPNIPPAMASPRMGGPPQSQPPVPGQQPVAGLPSGVPPHIPGQPPPGPNQPQHPMPGMMPGWGYYPYPQYGYPGYAYDPAMQSYWASPPPAIPHMQSPLNPQATPQQGQLPLHNVPPTPSQQHATVQASPRVPPAMALNTQIPPTPATPSVLTPSGPRPPGFPGTTKRISAISIKKPTGEEIDLHSLKVETPAPSTATSSPGTTATEVRKPVRLETEEANRKRLLDEGKEREKKEEQARRKAKREAEAAERAKRDQEEKERRKREEERRKEEEERKRKEEDQVEIDRQKEKERAEQEHLENERLEKERLEQERLEKERLEKERIEKERIEKERIEKERIERERQEAERLEKERLEKERLAKEEEERRKAEEERLRKEQEEERLRKEQEERELAEAEKKKAEEEAKAAAEAEAARLAEEEASRATPAQLPDSTPAASSPAVSTPAYSASPASVAATLPKTSTAPTEQPKRRPIPGRLDLSNTSGANFPPAPPSALASARIIEDIEKVTYPEGIKAPKNDLNVNAPIGKFRYDRDFLLQFMNVCKEKPDDLPPLDAIGLEPSEQPSFSGRGGRRGGAQGGQISRDNSRNSIGLGLIAPGFPKTFGGGGMGNFQGPRSSDERFAASNRSLSGSVPLARQPLTRTPSQSGSMPNTPLSRDGLSREGLGRSRSGRGRSRLDSTKGGVPPSQLGTAPVISDTPVEPLTLSENRWVGGKSAKAAVDESSPEYIDRKVKALLNKLTLEKFDSISRQILEWANRSVNETNGQTLIQVIRLVFEKATDEATWSEMYARLCRYLMERISPDVRDESLKPTAEGKPIAGGHLFRKYLLNRCQEDFERGWATKEAAQNAAKNKAADDKAAADAAEKAGEGEEVLYSDEYYAAQKAKRRGLGLVKFIGELFKLQMLTERIMHECIKKLLSNVESPEEEDIESLCKLLSTVGQILDTPKARNHMDIYFSRMSEMAKNTNLASRVQFMLLDVIELRERNWVARNQAAVPTTIAQVHEKAARERLIAEREALLRQTTNRDGNRRRDTRDFSGPPKAGDDGWQTPPSKAQTKVGDLSQFGKIGKHQPTQFGPTSVFSKRDKRDSTSVTRVNSSQNMYALLNSSEPTPDAVSVGSRTATSTRPPSRKASIDLGSGGSPSDVAPLRKRLALLPRTRTGEGSVAGDTASNAAPSEYGEDDSVSAAGTGTAATTMDFEQVKKKVAEDVKELFMLKDMNEVDGYFETIPAQHRNYLIETIFHKVIDGKEIEIKLACDVFSQIASKGLATEEQFEKGFGSDIEFLEDISVDVPMVYTTVARLMRAAKLSNATAERLANKIANDGGSSEPPSDKLMQKFLGLSA